MTRQVHGIGASLCIVGVPALGLSLLRLYCCERVSCTKTLDSEIRECYLHAAGAIAFAIGLQGKISRDGETLAPFSPRYEFAEQLPNFSKPVRKQGPFPVGDQ